MSNKSSEDEIETSQNDVDPIAGYSGAIVSTSKFAVEAERDCEDVQLKKSIKEKSSKLEKLQHEIRSLNEVLKYEKYNKSNLLKDLSKEQQTIFELNRNIEDLKSQLEHATNGLQDARKEGSAKVCELQKELSENHAKMVDMESQIQGFNAKIVDLNSQNTKFMCDNESISRRLEDLKTGLENISTISIKSFEKTGVNITPETQKTLEDYFEKNCQEKTNVNDHTIPGSSDNHDEDFSSQSTCNPVSTLANQHESSQENNWESFPFVALGNPDRLEVDGRLHFESTGMSLRLRSATTSVVSSTKLTKQTDSVELPRVSSKVCESQSSEVSNGNCDVEKVRFGRRNLKRRSKCSSCFGSPDCVEVGIKATPNKVSKTTSFDNGEIPPGCEILESTVNAEYEKDVGSTEGAEDSTHNNAE